MHAAALSTISFRVLSLANELLVMTAAAGGWSAIIALRPLSH